MLANAEVVVEIDVDAKQQQKTGGGESKLQIKSEERPPCFANAYQISDLRSLVVNGREMSGDKPER